MVDVQRRSPVQSVQVGRQVIFTAWFVQSRQGASHGRFREVLVATHSGALENKVELSEALSVVSRAPAIFIFFGTERKSEGVSS